MPRRLSREKVDPEHLAYTYENLEKIQQLIPSVMEQLQSDKQSVISTGGHVDMQSLARETELFLTDLQKWKSRAEDILEQQETLQQEKSSRIGSNKMDEFDEDDSDEGTMEGAEQRNRELAGRLGSRVVRDDFVVIFGNPVQERRCQGLFDTSSGMYYIFERRIRDTIYGYVVRAQSGRSVGGNRVQLEGGEFAIKVYQIALVEGHRARNGQTVQEDPIQELQYQKLLSTNGGHPGVMKLQACFLDEHFLYAVLPLAGMELFDMISSHGPFSESVCRSIFREMLSAIAFCHSHGIAHRDVSPENFLMDRRGGMHPILIDFGLAYKMEKNDNTFVGQDALHVRARPWKPIPYTIFVGKVMYAAPEMWGGVREYDGPSIDLWSAVVTLFVMMYQAPPWERARVTRQRDGYTSIVLSHNLVGVLRGWNFSASDLLVDLFQGVFREDPASRMSFEAVQAHEWMTMS